MTSFCRMCHIQMENVLMKTVKLANLGVKSTRMELEDRCLGITAMKIVVWYNYFKSLVPLQKGDFFQMWVPCVLDIQHQLPPHQLASNCYRCCFKSHRKVFLNSQLLTQSWWLWEEEVQETEMLKSLTWMAQAQTAPNQWIIPWDGQWEDCLSMESLWCVVANQLIATLMIPIKESQLKQFLNF